MQTTDDYQDDKRDFYRIQDTLVLEYQRISGPDVAGSFTEQSPVLGVLSDLHLLDYESQHLLRQIGERDRSLANYLKVINKRIDLLGKALAQQAAEREGKPVAVTLSEGGISFRASQDFEAGQWLSLRLVLQPTPLGLVLAGQVVRCEQLAEAGKWNVAVSFDNLNDQQRQLLARHILQKQAQAIRAARSTPSTVPALDTPNDPRSSE